MRHLLNLGWVLSRHTIQEPDGGLFWCRGALGLLGATRHSSHSDERRYCGANQSDL